MSTPEEFAEQFTQQNRPDDGPFNIGDRVVSRLCGDPYEIERGWPICGRIGGCDYDVGPQIAGRVIDKGFTDWGPEPMPKILIEITSSPEYPESVGRQEWVHESSFHRVDHAD